MINVFQPVLGADELAAVERVFTSNWVGKGNVTAEFEERFAQHLNVDSRFIQTVNSCTEGLFQAMALLDIGIGDEVILPTISFVGAANAIVACGAKPVFCDVDERTLNPTTEQIEEKITPRTKAVIILHYGGVPCHIEQIAHMVRSHHIPLIEDSACSVASRADGKACGTFGDIGLWSFDAMKILVTGDGGMIYCRTAELVERAERLLSLGLQVKSGLVNKARTRWWELEVSAPGRRGTMNDISAAIGIEQLKKLPAFIARRQEIHQYYDQNLTMGWLKRPPPIVEQIDSSYYFYWVQTEPGLRDHLALYLRENDIYTTFRYYPLHLVNFYQADVRLPQAEKAADSTLCLPIHHALSNDDLNKIADTIHQFGQGL